MGMFVTFFRCQVWRLKSTNISGGYHNVVITKKNALKYKGQFFSSITRKTASSLLLLEVLIKENFRKATYFQYCFLRIMKSCYPRSWAYFLVYFVFSRYLNASLDVIWLLWSFWIGEWIKRHWKIWPIYRLYEMSVDSEFIDLVLKTRMSVNLFYKHFV